MYFYGYWNHSEQSDYSRIPMSLHMPYYMFTTSITEIDIKYPKSTAGGLVVKDNLNFPRTCITFSDNTLNVQVPVCLFGTESIIEQSDPAYNFAYRLKSTTITGKWVIKDAVAPKTPAASALPLSFTVDGVQCYALGNSKTTYTDYSDDASIIDLYYPHNFMGYWQTHDFGYLQLDYSSNQYLNSDITGGFTRFTDDNGNVLPSLVGKVIDFGDSPIEVPLYFYEYISAISTPYNGIRVTIKSWDGVDTLTSKVLTDPIRKVIFSDNSYERNIRGIRIWTNTMNDDASSIPIRYEKPTDNRIFAGWSLSIRTNTPDFAEDSITEVNWNSDTIIYESYYEQEPGSIETITINLYRSTADSNMINKTGYLTTLGTYKGSLRSLCDVLNPVILIESKSLPSANYMFIKEFGNRWYFINGWKIVTTGLYELTASVDVLMTYKDKILELEAVVGKNEFQRNPMLEDKTYIMLPTYTVTKYKESTPFFDGPGSTLSNTNCNTVIVVGGDGGSAHTYDNLYNPNTQGVTAYTFNSTKLNGLARWFFTSNDLTSLLQKFWTNPETYIRSIRVYPFKDMSVTAERQESSISVGGLPIKYYPSIDSTEPENFKAYRIDHYSGKVSLLKAVKKYNDFRDYEPYTSCRLYVPFIGEFPLTCEDAYIGINIFISIDFTSGMAIFTVKRNDANLPNETTYDGTLLLQKSFQLGFDVNFGAVDNTQSGLRNIATWASYLSVGSVNLQGTGGVKTRPDLYHGPMGLLTSGVEYGLKSVGDTITNGLSTQYTSISCNDSQTEFFSDMEVKIYVKRNDTIRANNAQRYDGYPILKTDKLKNFKGYTRVNDIHTHVSATSEEQKQIYDLLTTGVII